MNQNSKALCRDPKSSAKYCTGFEIDRCAILGIEQPALFILFGRLLGNQEHA